MIPFKIGKSEINIPSGYSEITYGQCLKLKNAESLRDKFFILSGLSIDLITDELLTKISPWIMWITEPPEIDKNIDVIKIGSELYFIPKNLGACGTWRQYRWAAEKIYNCYEKNIDIDAALLPVVSCYLYPVVSGRKFREDEATSAEFENTLLKCSFVDLFSCFNYFVEEIIRLVNRDAKFIFRQPDAKSILAGVDKLKKFKDWFIIDELSGNDLLKQEALLDIEYDVIFFKLWRDAEKNDFNKRLEKVYEQKRNK